MVSTLLIITLFYLFIYLFIYLYNNIPWIFWGKTHLDIGIVNRDRNGIIMMCML